MIFQSSLVLCIAALGQHALAHNFIECTNAKPDLSKLLHTPTTDTVYHNPNETCGGYPRAFPAADSPFFGLTGDQGYPWRFIWPTQDHTAIDTHRACHWNQENPVYDPQRPVTKVKPGATIMLRITTNNHAHEYEHRQAGTYKIYLAGSSGTQVTTIDQLTDSRCIYKSPENRYAHIAGSPVFGPYGGDVNLVWVPLKLVDPTGAYLPPGTYNFVFSWWWPTGPPNSANIMWPSYTTCFDIVIDEAAEDPGFLTEMLKNDSQLYNTLIGDNVAPGGKDRHSPWPPYTDNYLTTNYDGTDPDTDCGKKTYSPFFKKHIDATPMPPLSSQVTRDVAQLSETERQSPINLPPGANASAWPPYIQGVPSTPSCSTLVNSTQDATTPMHINGTVAGTNANKTNSTMSPGSTAAMPASSPIDAAAGTSTPGNTNPEEDEDTCD